MILLDWGLSETGPIPAGERRLCCTPSYVAPEYVQGKAVDWRADLYSLGVVLYEMITGKNPFKASSAHEMLDCHTTQEVDLSEIKGPMKEIINRCLMKKPEDRYMDLDEFLGGLESVQK